MIYLLWGLTNLALIVVFLSLCFHAIKLVRKDIGKPAAIILAVGLFSFIAIPDSEPPGEFTNLGLKKKELNDSPVNQVIRPIRVVLQDNLISTYELLITYGRKSLEYTNEPIRASSSVNGVIMGIRWIPERYFVEKTWSNKEFKYSVSGTIKWKMLGFTVFSEYKNYEGRASIN